jgi:hypothetical protein
MFKKYKCCYTFCKKSVPSFVKGGRCKAHTRFCSICREICKSCTSTHKCLISGRYDDILNPRMRKERKKHKNIIKLFMKNIYWRVGAKNSCIENSNNDINKK